MFKSLLILILILSSTAFANDYKNRFSLGPLSKTYEDGFIYYIEALRIIEDTHAVFFRSLQATDSSDSEYVFGYRYFFGNEGWNDSWFVEGKYTLSREISRYDDPDFINGGWIERTEVEEDKYIGLVFGYQWVFYERINFEYGAGFNFDSSTFEREEVTGVLSLGYLF